MKSIGFRQNIDRKGRIGIPKEIGMHSVSVEILVKDEQIILRRCNLGECVITGKTSRRNISLGDGIIKVHPKAVGQLMNILKQYLEKE